MHRHGRCAIVLLVGLAVLLGSTELSASNTAAQVATPATDCPATTPDENLAVVRSFFEDGVNGANLAVFDRVAAPDIVYHGATVGDESGLEALKRTYGEALTGFPGIQYTLLTSVADGDAVALRFLVEGVHTGEFRGLAPSGETIIWNHSAFAHVACGRISEMWAEVDQLDRLQAFGILAAEGPAARMAGAESHPAATPALPAESADCAPQSPEEMIAVVDRVRAEVYNAENFDVMPEIFAEGYLHGSANGPDAIGIAEGVKRIEGFVTALPDLEWTFDEVIAGGDRVAARWTTRGTHDGDLLGFAPTGKPVEFTGISFFTVRCAKVIEFQTEMDAAGLLEQVGAPVRDESQ
jgi:predicted ester cyclase